MRPGPFYFRGFSPLKSALKATMKLTINGEEREVRATDLSGLIAELGLDPRKVAVERNLEIVPRSRHGATLVAEGDRIEMVQFVGGG